MPGKKKQAPRTQKPPVKAAAAQPADERPTEDEENFEHTLRRLVIARDRL